MARNNMNFSASLRLDTKEFNKGVKSVQKSLNGLKNTFTQFAAGIGLSLGLNRLIGQLRETSVQLDTAKNVLHNVSESTAEYGDSIIYLQRISNDYNQDLIVLMNTFGQFRAAAASTNLTIDQQRDIFESLTRAAGAFHMSADRTKDMMIAVQQMFSKGKVAAEELRRQLGNSLPGAFNLMAKAAQLAGITTNGTTEELEEMMRKGKVLAEDVMPAFAAVLDAVTAGSNFDSLQGSLNRFKNAWIKFVEKSSFGDFFKKFVDVGTKSLDKLANNFSKFSRFLISGAAGVLGSMLWRNGATYVQTWANNAAKDIDKAHKIMGQSSKELEKYLKEPFDKNIKSIELYKSKLEALKNPAQYDQFKRLFGDDYKKVAKNVIAYTDATVKLARTEKSLGIQTSYTNKELKALEKRSAEFIKNLQSDGVKVVAGVSNINKVLGAMRSILKGVGAAFKAAFSTILIGTMITLLTNLVGKLIEVRNNEKRIRDMVKNTNEALEKTKDIEITNIAKLEEAKKIIEDTKQGSVLWNKALKTINLTLGRTGDKIFTAKSDVKEIVAACDKWKERLLKIAKAQAAMNMLTEKNKRLIELQIENSGITGDANFGLTKPVANQFGAAYQAFTREAEKLNIQLELNNQEIEGLETDLKNIYSFIETEQLQDFFNLDDDDTDKPVATLKEFKEAIDKQKEAFKKLENQHKAGAYTEEEYKKKQNDLIVSTYEAITAFDNFEGLLAKLGQSNWFGQIAEKFRAIRLEMIDSTEDIEAYDNAMSELASHMMDDWEKAQEKVYTYKTPEMPKKENRSTVFDYKKSQTDIIGEEIEITENRIKELSKKIDEAKEGMNQGVDDAVKDFARLYAEFIKMGKELDTLKEKMIFAELEADVKSYQQQMFDGVANGIKNTATSMDRLVSSTKDLIETLDNPNVSVWEQIMAIFNEMVQIFDTITGFIEMFNTLSKIGALLTGAEAALEKEKAKTKSDEAALTGTIAGEEAAALTTEIASVAANKARASSLLTAAGAAASMNAMELPYPENLAALASNIAAVAAGIGSIKALNTFANGGIVGGNSTLGDKNVIRANSGEMILTKGQQGTLFNMLNGKGGLGGGNVEFKIRGADLVGTLNNYNNKKRG